MPSCKLAPARPSFKLARRRSNTSRQTGCAENGLSHLFAECACSLHIFVFGIALGVCTTSELSKHVSLFDGEDSNHVTSVAFSVELVSCFGTSVLLLLR